MDAPTATLAAWAAHDDRSRGRRWPEPPPAYRSEFQRDRDRIIHSTAFRRLVYKTQVFVNHEGDLYRTRLTHSLEVSQIARTAARALGLNEHLVEAICLAHDLGHTPFGHAGQDALNRCMRDYGGFEHNLQSLRVVDELEEKYAEFRGLNLTFETREGILKHCSARHARALGDVGERFLARRQPGLEAQLANLADEIAYNHHDIDDGLRAGLIDLDELKGLDCFGAPYREVRRRYADLDGRRLVNEVLRRMIDRVVTDLVETTRARIADAAPQDIDDVRGAGSGLAGFSGPTRESNLALKQYLSTGLYQHYRVLRMTRKAGEVVDTLFERFFGDVRLMPPEFAAAARHEESLRKDAGRARVVADYIAGMTDRYAILEHERVVDPRRHT